MSIKTQAAIAAEILANVSDPLTKQNTPAKLRQVLDDLNDTMFGGSGQTIEASLSLTSAQILTLNSVPIDIIAAPGVGKYIEVISASISFTYVSAVYTTNLILQLINTGADVSQFESLLSLASVLSKNIKFVQTAEAAAVSTQIITNTALQVKVKTGNPAAGDGTAIIKLLYRIVTI